MLQVCLYTLYTLYTLFIHCLYSACAPCRHNGDNTGAPFSQIVYVCGLWEAEVGWEGSASIATPCWEAGRGGGSDAAGAYTVYTVRTNYAYMHTCRWPL